MHFFGSTDPVASLIIWSNFISTFQPSRLNFPFFTSRFHICFGHLVPRCNSDWTLTFSSSFSSLKFLFCFDFNSLSILSGDIQFDFFLLQSLDPIGLRYMSILCGSPSEPSGYNEWVCHWGPLTQDTRPSARLGSPWQDILRSCKICCLDVVQYNCHCSTGYNAAHPKAPRLKKINLVIGFWKKSICDWKCFCFNLGRSFRNCKIDFSIENENG
jgi:hypothetical protein